jgi:hypothetical protein
MYGLLELDKLKRFMKSIGFASLVYRDRFSALSPLLVGESNLNQGENPSYRATKNVEEVESHHLDKDQSVLDQSVKFGTLESCSQTLEYPLQVVVSSASSKRFDDKTTLIISESLNDSIDQESIIVNQSPIGLLEISLGDFSEYNSGWLRWTDRPDPPLPPYYVFQWGINFRFRPLKTEKNKED